MFVTFRSYGAKTGESSYGSINIPCLRHFSYKLTHAIRNETLSPFVIKLRLRRLTVIGVIAVTCVVATKVVVI